MDLNVESRYVHLPVKNGADKAVCRFVLEVCGGGGRVMMSFGGALYTRDGALLLGGDARIRRLSVHRMHSAWGLP